MIDLQSIFITVAHAAETATTTESSGGVIGTLGINGQLFIAQLINFAIILFVLWKWVLTPVAKKLQERTEKIEKSLNDADRIENEKHTFEQWRQEEMSKTRKEASGIITTAQTEAGKAKEQIIQQTKEEQSKLVEQARVQIEQEKNQALSSAKAELADLVTTATEKILRRKLDDKKDAELVKESISELK